MKTIFKIAWRNVWRNKLRSGIVFTSIVLGVWAGLFVMAMGGGMLEQQKRGTLQSQISHFQIHTDDFLADIKLKNRFSDAQLSEVESVLANNKQVKNFSRRSIVEGTGTTAHGFSNLKVIGVNPEIEKTVTTIHERLIDGSYFSKYKNKPVLVGRKLAEELHLEIGKTINLSLQDSEGNLTQVGFKVEGIFGTPSQSFDLSNVFVKQSDLQELILSEEPYIHEIAVNLQDVGMAKEVSKEVNGQITKATARDWAIISPELSFRDETAGASLMVILLIIVFALTFGIVNTMLMAVLERKRELGMLLCIGMNRQKVFVMIMMETILLAVAAVPLGLVLSWLSITYFGNAGINLDAVGDALYKAGMDSMVYPAVDSSAYITISVMIVAASLIASIIPARKALKYNPAEAVRAV